MDAIGCDEKEQEHDLQACKGGVGRDDKSMSWARCENGLK